MNIDLWEQGNFYEARWKGELLGKLFWAGQCEPTCFTACVGEMRGPDCKSWHDCVESFVKMLRRKHPKAKAAKRFRFKEHSYNYDLGRHE